MKHTTIITRGNIMSKNTAKVAQAISLLSDVLSNEAESELSENTEAVDNNTYDELKDQAVTYSDIIDSDLSIISHDLEVALDLVGDTVDTLHDVDDNHTWDNSSIAGEVYTTGFDDVSKGSEGTHIDDDGTGVAVKLGMRSDTITMEREINELEKNNENLTDQVDELTRQVDDLTDTLRGVTALVENLTAATDTFVTELKSL